jgi:DNA-binding NarL/FixJ family response regulator
MTQPGPPTARVLLADDHVPTRYSVRVALEADGLDVVAECGSGGEALVLAQLHRPDVCLLDVRMPGGGIATAAALRREVPGVTVVMLTSSRDRADLVGAVRAGARGYLLKDRDLAELGPALRRVLAGGTDFPRSAMRELDVRDAELATTAVGGRPDGARGLRRRGMQALRRLAPRDAAE